MCARWKNLWLLTLALSLFPGVSRSQTAPEASPPAQSVVVPWRLNTLLLHPGNAQFTESELPMLNELLRETNPTEIAAAAFDIPVEKIELVPHVYWREAKWVDWATKADQAKGPPPSFGPDGKLAMAAEISPFSHLQLEFGPVPWKNPANEAKFAIVADQVLQRVAAKMVRLAPEFSVNFKRQQLVQDYNRILQRLRDLNDQIEKLRREIGAEGGLPPAQLTERLADLSKQQLATRLSLHEMKAREMAIRKQMDRTKAQADAKIDENQTLRTLKRIVDLRKSRFETLKQQNAAGVLPKGEMEKAEEEMLAAMVEVDRAVAAMQKDSSQSLLDQLTTELSKVSIERAEAEARSEFLDNAVAETDNAFAKRRDNDAKADELRSQLTALEHRRTQLQEQRNQAEDDMNEPIEPLQITLQER